MPIDRAVIVGAGIGGLACAIELACQGVAVEVVERAGRAGGKMREIEIDGVTVDSGPTVLTMRWVFDELFAAAGSRLEGRVGLTQLPVLARHAWNDREYFDLHADIRTAADAVGRLSGPEEARRFLAFCAEARRIYDTLKQPFLESQRAGPLELSSRIGWLKPGQLFGIRPFETYSGALAKSFRDPRLRQLFGRYATYNGSSPFLAPATLMLIAHVEREGVWSVTGGMQRLADALVVLAGELGVTFRYNAVVRRILVEKGSASGVVLDSGERLLADAVVVNADPTALFAGLFGHAAIPAGAPGHHDTRSLSAVTWTLQGEGRGFPLLRHNVFFSEDYAAEFEDLFRHRRVPRDPTTYVCAQDRLESDHGGDVRPERLFMLVNAPATGDLEAFDAKEIAACETRMMSRLARCGLTIARTSETRVITTPADFHRLFPATGGALYGRVSHGWKASFERPGSQTAVPRLYLAGGSTHPGAGVPMAALSGRLAAARLLSDRHSTRSSRLKVISGGT